MRVGNMLRRADFQKNFILMTFKAIQYKFKMSDIKRLRHNSSHKQIFFKKKGIISFFVHHIFISAYWTSVQYFFAQDTASSYGQLKLIIKIFPYKKRH